MDTTDTIQLLTAAPWKFLSYEYDYNSDAEIDTGEENIDDCKKQISTYSNASVTKIDRNKLIPTDTNEEPVKLITIYEH